MDWKVIGLVVCLFGMGYLLGNLYPLSKQVNERTTYIVNEKEFRYHDSIVVKNNNKETIKKEFEKDTSYISSVPDSLLLRELLTRARELSE